MGEGATLAEIAELLERHRIERVPVVRESQVAGIVSRANLIRGLASQPAAAPKPAAGDRALRERLEAEIRRAGVDAPFINVVASGGEVHLWGIVRSAQQADAAPVAAEAVAGSAAATSHLSVLFEGAWAMGWVE